MPCYHPVTGYQSDKHLTENGKRKLVFQRKLVQGQRYDEVQVPFGRCIGCRLDKSRQWAIRCVHEASLYDHNCFITLTYDDDHLNPTGLVKADFQNFMKRFRKQYVGCQPVTYKNKKRYPIRYFACGEYGEKFKRPHFHACIFNFDFLDKELWSTRDGVKLYRSEKLERLWQNGFSTIGDVSFESAAYVARYVTKKITGDRGIEHYMSDIDTDTGECSFIEPEFGMMSRRPGIGLKFYEKYREDCYPSDFITHNGVKHSIPKYYDKLHEKHDAEAINKIKMIRRIKRNIEDNTLSRLAVRERVKKAQTKTLKRSYENEA